jgi:hypothetical protein
MRSDAWRLAGFVRRAATFCEASESRHEPDTFPGAPAVLRPPAPCGKRAARREESAAEGRPVATILKLTDGIAIENDSLRLTFPLEDGQIRQYSLYGRSQEAFHLAGTVDPVSQIRYRTDGGATAVEPVVASGYEMDRNGADCILRLESEFHDADGVRWSTVIEFYVPDSGARATVTSRLSVSRPRRLLAFRGPFLRVPRNPDAPRGEALFPGLDWLIDGEPSSSEQTAPRPFNARHVPHPYKITIPLMAVARQGTVSGITWDPLQVWDGERVQAAAHRYPAAVFASPDFIEDQDAHLMGLFLPSVPKFVDENTLAAARPYEMSPGRELRLECSLFVRNGDRAVDAIPEHFHASGLVQPPAKTRDYKENLELDIATFLDRAWSPQQAAWAQTGTPEEKWPFYSEQVALALWRASLFARDHALRSRMRECVEAAVYAHGSGGLSMAYFRGGFAEELAQAKGQLDKLIASQHEDGGWSADDDALGRRGQKSLVGATAEHAGRLLRSGLLTGDHGHLDAGMKAVRFLDAYSRPSGLRVWDVHETAPDLLAAAHLLTAYLDLYLITGSPARLQRAVYWAWAGLPFVYLWHAHNREVMRYATVPFFAVTRMDKKPWFGVAAQWNGLEYARQLFRLSRHDRTMRWHRIGRAITLCGMQLQKTARNAPPSLVGFLPDAYNIVDGRDYYPLCVNPQLVTRNVLHLLGEDLEPTCEIVPWRERRSRVATVAHILAIRSSPHQMMVRLGYHRGETCHLTLAECDRPTEVRLGERPLEEVDRLHHAQSCWRFDAERNLTLVRLTFDEAEEVCEFRF